MDLTPYVDDFRHELAVAADAGGDEARALARRLTAPLETAARLTLLNALSAAMGEVTRDLAPGCSVTVQLRGLDPEFVVTPAPDAQPHGAAEQHREAQRRGTAEQHHEAPRPLPASMAPVIPLTDPGPPSGYIRVQFADAGALESAAPLFDRAVPDHETLALRLPSDGSVPALRAVLDALDDAAVEATALTVHTADLDDVFHALVGLPQQADHHAARTPPGPRRPRKSPKGDAG
ncbi:hypothetical protein STRAU_3295 [Streptomyces aurantiacus JA 4570]|uniref:DUF4162 domain-containing protein n=1 Tax=Streptomyces aurantiacus JA 4570 TaxID=1286094 RepID=S3ZJB8_9ACTN|nr:hypothetical protein STRAU_3295 [Streptomyces aurantiacus JA 4570]